MHGRIKDRLAKIALHSDTRPDHAGKLIETLIHHSDGKEAAFWRCVGADFLEEWGGAA